ncbi:MULTISPECIES: phage tail protein [Photorhabdus]|nr:MULTISPECIES: phage tail protein [Photorhabdus]
MSSYNTGTISIAANSDIAIGTGTHWKDNKFGVAPAQTILIKVGNTFKLSAIKNVNSDTELVLIDKFSDAVSNATYFIQTSVPDTYSDAARKVTAQLGYTDELLFNLNKWMTENGVVTVVTPEGKTIQLKSINALASDISNRLTKNQNGADIPDKNAFVKNLGLVETVERAKSAVPNSRKINGKPLTGDVSLSAGDVGACRAYSGSINTGGGTWTTKEFIVWLKQNGAFDVPYWMCKGSWSYASNRIINDTGCGNICLAGAVVEVMGVESAMTIRVTTPTTTSGNGIANAQFTYINHGEGYYPGWRRDYTKDEVVPTGVPLPYPHRYTPPGYLTCNGQTFDKSQYPRLAEAYPAGRVPDLRGEFIRGWDDSRGVDPGRVCGTWQADENKSHSHILPTARMAVGVDSTSSTWVVVENDVSQTKVSTHASGANETRPRNVAFNYIVRAV